MVFDYGTMTGGRPHYVYPQHELVARLCERWWTSAATSASGRGHRAGPHDDGSRCRSSTVGRSQHDSMPGRGRLRWRPRCDRGLACATARSSSSRCRSGGSRCWATTAPAGAAHDLRGAPARVRRADAAAADADPLLPRGAGAPTRSPTGRRPRVREELTTRLMVPGRLDDVQFIEPSLVDLRMRMTTPMQDGRVFVAGDAAHVITPAGGKGMNLAIQDAVELAHGFHRALRTRGRRRLAWPTTPTRACRRSGGRRRSRDGCCA